MYIWFPYNTLISRVRPYKTPPLKARKAGTAKDLTMPRLQAGILYGFRITHPSPTAQSRSAGLLTPATPRFNTCV